jgi:hypothetical protein
LPWTYPSSTHLEREHREIKRDQNEAYHNGHDPQNHDGNPRQSALQAGADLFLIEFRDAGEHGGKRARGFTDLDHFKRELGNQFAFPQGWR